MKNLFILFLATLFIISCKTDPKAEVTMAIDYPETKQVDTITNYFGTDVKDPYIERHNRTDGERGTGNGEYGCS